MNQTSFLLVFSGVLLNVLGQLALKASVQATGEIGLSTNALWSAGLQIAGQPWLWFGLLCYGVSVIVWLLALSRVAVSIAYPMLSLGYVINALVAWLWFGESMSMMKWLGIMIILCGVVVLTRS
jgi:multidrug transporter EmrE-like cation transporter